MQINGQEQNQKTRPVLSPTSGLAPVPNQPGSAPAADTRLEDYLDAVCALVPVEVPASSVQDMRQEMRSHLQTAVTAGEELGQTRDAATAHALAQFGEPQAVARHWQREWETTLETAAQVPVWPSLTFASKIWIVASLAALTTAALTASLVYSDAHGLRGPLILSTLVALPLITGTIIGLRARRHPVLCTLGGCLLMTPLLVFGFVAVSYLSYYQAVQVTGKPMELYRSSVTLASGLNSALSCLPTWLILSGFSSGVMAIGRRLRTRKRHQIAR